MPEITTNEKFARRYAKLGWHIFPIKPKEKIPLIRRWPTRATTEFKQIHYWWQKWPDANIGIVTGQISGFFVVDIDTYHNGDWTLSYLEDSFGSLPPSAMSSTGNGGKHLLFQYPEKVISNSSGKLGEGLDIRGNGGYIVAPPSLHPSGANYRWIAPPWKQKIALPPTWLVDLLAPPKIDIGNFENNFLAIEENGMLWVKRAIRRVRRGSGRNDTAFWLACQLRDLGFNQRQAWGFMRAYTQLVPDKDHEFTMEESKRALINAFNSTTRRPQAVKLEKLCKQKN